MIDYKNLRKLLVHLIKLGNPKGTKVKTKLVTTKTGEKEIRVWTWLPTVQYINVEFKIETDKPPHSSSALVSCPKFQKVSGKFSIKDNT